MSDGRLPLLFPFVPAPLSMVGVGVGMDVGVGGCACGYECVPAMYRSDLRRSGMQMEYYTRDWRIASLGFFVCVPHFCSNEVLPKSDVPFEFVELSLGRLELCLRTRP